jgi:hypothetical protein
MSIIKLGLDGLSVPDEIQYARQLAQAITGNPNVPTPKPTMPQLNAAADALETAYNDAQAARQLAKSKTSVQDDAAAALGIIIAQLANFVENACDGDKAKIESAGFSVRNPPVPIGELPAPTDLQVAPSEHAGSADLSWSAARGARSFTVERAEDGPALNFSVIGNTTKKQASFNTMLSGRKYWHRVAAIGAAGQSAWSDPVPMFAS